LAAAVLSTSRAGYGERHNKQQKFPHTITSKLDSSSNARSPARERVVNQEDYDGAHNRDQETVNIQPGYVRHAEGAEQPPAHDRADDSENDIQEHALTGLIDDFAADESGNQAQNDPSDN
jgi:hypothetical protein